MYIKFKIFNNFKMNDIIKFLKTRNVKSPSRSNKYDAGIDFYIPELTPQYLEDFYKKNSCEYVGDINVTDGDDGVKIHIPPQKRVLLPSGIHCQMSEPGRALIAANKSGVATKTGLVFGAQIVDFEYQGEIHLSLINTSDEEVVLTGGMKILQFIEMPVFNSDIEVEEDKSVVDFYLKETTRGANGFGSSDMNQ